MFGEAFGDAFGGRQGGRGQQGGPRRGSDLRYDLEITLEQAYQISLQFLQRREALGERVIGKKIGVTSRAVQEMQPFDEAYERIDWSPYANLPTFEAANRRNAYTVYLELEAEALGAAGGG